MECLASVWPNPALANVVMQRVNQWIRDFTLAQPVTLSNKVEEGQQPLDRKDVSAHTVPACGHKCSRQNLKHFPDS